MSLDEGEKTIKVRSIKELCSLLDQNLQKNVQDHGDTKKLSIKPRRRMVRCIGLSLIIPIKYMFYQNKALVNIKTDFMSLD